MGKTEEGRDTAANKTPSSDDQGCEHPWTDFHVLNVQDTRRSRPQVSRVIHQ